jgi:SAM-dependent methyltransferase
MNGRAHWDTIYATKAPDAVSWYQAEPSVSRELIEATGSGHDARIIDVGGGASILVDHLLKDGFERLGVLDLSSVALDAAQRRLGAAGSLVQWIHADVLEYRASQPWNVWHDRAVFHFLVEPLDRARYRASLYRAIPEGGHVIVATFGLGGPDRCSGLPTLQCSAEDVARELGSGVELVEARTEEHVTPAGARQEFVYARLARIRATT